MSTKDQNINYLNKSFSDFKESLIQFAKWYFPNTYADFTDSEPGTMFLEMASYVGDVVGFYVDTQIQENMMLQSKEVDNATQMSYVMGYSPKMSYASVAEIDMYQVVQATSSLASGSIPKYSDAVVVSEYTQLTSVNGTKFVTVEEARFDQASNPEVVFRDTGSFYLKQTVKAISAEVKTATFNFGAPVKFDSVSINDNNILEIIKVADSNSEVWYEVDYNANSTIIIRTPNPNYSNDGIPYLLQYQNVPKRFTSRFSNSSTLNLYFGAGVTNVSDTVLLPGMDNLNLGNQVVPANYFQGQFNKAKSMYTQEYGLAPANLTLTVSYLVGGGLSSNVDANQINVINTSGITFSISDPYKQILVTNPSKSAGGRSGDTIDEIKFNALAAFQAQNRGVTKQDYVLRAFSMPSDFGKISKALIIQDSKISNNSGNDMLIDNNPLSLSMYLLSYDTEGKLTTAATVLKQNLASYLEDYRMATDAINLKDAFVVNIGVNFDVTTTPGYSNSEVLSNCVLALQDYFSTDKWQINQPIIMSELYSLILQTKGVASCPNIQIYNKQGGNYSQYGYDIAAATRKNIVYLSIDPCIFEVKYPQLDIAGRTV